MRRQIFGPAVGCRRTVSFMAVVGEPLAHVGQEDDKGKRVVIPETFR